VNRAKKSSDFKEIKKMFQESRYTFYTSLHLLITRRWKVTLILLLIAEMIASISFKEFKSIDHLTNFTANVGIGFVYVYLPLLLIIKMLKNNFFKKGQTKSSEIHKH
jgi:hypothetical protein